MLIEKLRKDTEVSRQGINEMIGVLSSLQPYLDQIAQPDSSPYQESIVTKEMTELYEAVSQLRVIMADQDLSFASIKNAIQHLIRYCKSLNKGYFLNTQKSFMDSPPQKEDWNVPQRISKLVLQNQYEDDDPNRLQVNNESLKQSLEQIQVEREK